MPVQEADVSGDDAGDGEVHSVLSPGRGERSLDRWGADGDAVHGGLRREDSLTEPRQNWGGWAVGGRSLEPTVLHHSGGTGGVTVVPTMGDGAEWVLHSPAASATGIHPADVWAGRGRGDREVLGAEPGVVGGAAVVAGEPANHLPV